MEQSAPKHDTEAAAAKNDSLTELEQRIVGKLVFRAVYYSIEDDGKMTIKYANTIGVKE